MTFNLNFSHHIDWNPAAQRKFSQDYSQKSPTHKIQVMLKFKLNIMGDEVEIIIRLLETKYLISFLTINSTSSISFNISTEYQGEAQCLQITLDLSRNLRFKINTLIPRRTSPAIISKTNKTIKLGTLIQTSESSFCLAYCLPEFVYQPEVKLEILISILHELIKTFLHLNTQQSFSVEQLTSHIQKSCNLNSSSEIESDESDFCEVCVKPADDCVCLVDFPMAEDVIVNDRKQIDLIKSSGISKYFDFDQGFYSPDTCEYFYNPSNLLENQLKKFKISESFISQFNNLLDDMKKHFFFFRTFPKHILLASVTNNKITGLSIALIFKSQQEMQKNFRNSFPGFSEFMKNKMMELCIMTTNKKLLTSEDWIDLNKLENPFIDQGELLGSGGFANVYKNSLLGKEVAIKVPNLRKEDLSESIRRIEREFAISKKMNDKFIVKTHGVVEYEQKKCIVFEFCRGSSLRKSGNLSLEAIQNIMKGIACGMHKIHKAGYVHQDLNPSNIIVVNSCPKIIDFGLAAEISELSLHQGFTVEYADPGQLQYRSPGQAADIWSYGLVFISSIINCHPYSSVIAKAKITTDKHKNFAYEISHYKKRPIFSAILQKISEPLSRLIISCLNSSPSTRPSFIDFINLI